MKNSFSGMSNLQGNFHLKLDFQNVDQHTGGKWLIHDTKHSKDNRLESWEYSSSVYKFYLKWRMVTWSIYYFNRRSRGRNIPGGEELQNQNYLD